MRVIVLGTFELQQRFGKSCWNQWPGINRDIRVLLCSHVSDLVRRDTKPRYCAARSSGDQHRAGTLSKL